MAVTQKDYDYDQVIAFTNSGGPLDSALSKLQNDLKKLRQTIEEVEPLYHGKGAQSSVYLSYENLYNKIGTTSTDKSMWLNASVTKDLINLMYNNALNDQQKDIGA